MDPYNQPFQIHEDRRLVESVYRLSLSDFGRGLLKPVSFNGDTEGLQAPPVRGKSGQFKLVLGLNALMISYKAYLDGEYAEVVLDYNTDPKNPDKVKTQTLRLAEFETNIGTRPYFTCPGCEARREVLYLSPNTREFSCQSCQGLVYEITTINRHSMDGLFYYTSRVLSLMKRRERIRKPIHAGKHTKRMERLNRDIVKLENSYAEDVRGLAMFNIMRANDRIAKQHNA